MYLFKFADIGEGIHEGTILKWLVKEGDKVKDGDTLVIVETDKVNAELPSPVNGVVKKINFKEGADIHVGDVIIEIDDGSGTAPIADQKPQKVVEEEKASEKGAGVVGEIDVSDELIVSAPEVVVQTTSKKVLASPVARKVAADMQIDLSTIKGTGPQGRVLKDDVLSFSKPQVLPSVSLQDEIEVVKISRHRKAISNSMTISKQTIPHTVLFTEVRVDKLVNFRDEAKVVAANEGVKLTYLAFISRAVVIALKDFKTFNATYDEVKGEIYLRKHINLGIAVDTEAGLIVPNIKNAASQSLFGLAIEIETLAEKAANKSLTLEEQQQGSFTITNFGSVGIPYGTPIIYHPEVAILGIGRIEKKPVVAGDVIEVGHVLPLSLAVDHRIIDGADAGRFLNRVKELLSNPTLLVLS